jgi:acyl-CoA synthetase (AMP-forming)/AMP-acid ligase II
VAGLPDEYYGEIVGAAIRHRPETAPPAPEELQRFCHGKLADYKIPVRWLIVEEFPLTASGKIRKEVLGGQIAARGSAADR